MKKLTAAVFCFVAHCRAFHDEQKKLSLVHLPENPQRKKPARKLAPASSPATGNHLYEQVRPRGIAVQPWTSHHSLAPTTEELTATAGILAATEPVLLAHAIDRLISLPLAERLALSLKNEVAEAMARAATLPFDLSCSLSPAAPATVYLAMEQKIGLSAQPLYPPVAEGTVDGSLPESFVLSLEIDAQPPASGLLIPQERIFRLITDQNSGPGHLNETAAALGLPAHSQLLSPWTAGAIPAPTLEFPRLRGPYTQIPAIQIPQETPSAPAEPGMARFAGAVPRLFSRPPVIAPRQPELLPADALPSSTPRPELPFLQHNRQERTAGKCSSLAEQLPHREEFLDKSAEWAAAGFTFDQPSEPKGRIAGAHRSGATVPAHTFRAARMVSFSVHPDAGSREPIIIGLAWLSGSSAAQSSARALVPNFSGLRKVSLNDDSLEAIKANIQHRAATEIVDDFRQGPGDWVKGWTYDPADFPRLRQLALYTPSLDDYRFEFLGSIERRDLSWVFRAADGKNYCLGRLEITRSGPLPAVELVRWAVVNGRPGPQEPNSLSVEARLDTIYCVRVDVKGSDFVTTVQGEVVDVFTDERLPRGGVGFLGNPGEDSQLRWVEDSHQYDILGRLCAYLVPYNLSNPNARTAP